MPVTKSKKGFKSYFLAGLVALLPLWVTFIFLRAIFYIISNATRPFLYPILREWTPLEYVPFLSDLVCFLGTILLVYLTGRLVTNLVGRQIFDRAERTLTRLPVVSDIYMAVRKLTDLFLGQDKSKFKRVVLVEFPRKGMYAIGFLTCDQTGEVQEKTREFVVNVFVPTTPNPTSGFLFMVPREQVTPLDMTIDEAIRMIVSGGLVMPSYSSGKDKDREVA
jgi:uncharacterized membrane protein